MNKIHIFDTTLRDGEQSPGAKLNTDEKVLIAKQLEKLGVDIIEAGFPISSPGDFESVKKISKAVRNCSVCALTRARKEDIDSAAEALKYSGFPRIHTGIGASDIHIKNKFHSTREKILTTGIEAVKYAKKYVSDVEFFAEDAGRADPEFLALMVEKVIEAGATVVNIPDTTGYCFPDEFGNKIKYLVSHVSNIEKAVISVHCHNDLGLATANTLSGIINGARQAEVTINGIGERAGNTSLEEIVMALHTRQHSMSYVTGINTKEIHKTSQLVSKTMGIPVQPNKAIVGSNAFAHSSGIHQDGVLKNRENYEIIDPSVLGISGTSIILTARSGRAALKHRLSEIGINADGKKLDNIYQEFLKLADVKKEIFDEDLRFLAGLDSRASNKKIRLILIQAISGNRNIPTATIKLAVLGKIKESLSTGDGPIDAAFKAIDECVGKKYKLKEFMIQAITTGSDAQARVNVAIEREGKIFWGHGANPDTIVSCALAYIDAINKFY